jgi:hypothetical protein
MSDVVLDCSDNFATRHAINRACVKHRKPLVSGAAIRFDGQVSVFDLRQPDSPCYHCLFPEGEDIEEVRCAVMGVFAPLTGIIGATQAAEALEAARRLRRDRWTGACFCSTGWPWSGAASPWGVIPPAGFARQPGTLTSLRSGVPHAVCGPVWRRSSPSMRMSTMSSALPGPARPAPEDRTGLARCCRRSWARHSTASSSTQPRAAANH